MKYSEQFFRPLYVIALIRFRCSGGMLLFDLQTALLCLASHRVQGEYIVRRCAALHIVKSSRDIAMASRLLSPILLGALIHAGELVA